MKVVLDTSVLVAAVRSATGASRALLVLALNRQIEPAISVPLFLEYEAVLSRNDQLLAIGMNRKELNGFLDDLLAVSELVNLTQSYRPSLPDPDDEMVLETALNGEVDMLITANIRDFEAAAERFGITVLLPAEALRIVRRDK